MSRRRITTCLVMVACLLAGTGVAAAKSQPSSRRHVAPSHLDQDRYLNAGQSLTSDGHAYTVTMRPSGVLVETDAHGHLEWSSDIAIPGSVAILRPSGALVVIAPSGRVTWTSGSHASGRLRLVLSAGGALEVRRASGAVIWSNGLQSRCSRRLPSQAIIVSISLQHLWACNGVHLVLSSAVTTGAYEHGWITPSGTWRIYAKEQNVNLIGPSWDDHVKYWMPYHGPFGLHDASWQTFPEGSPAYKTQGSHGCTHLPAAAMTFIYRWARIGAEVSIRAT